MPLVHSIAMSGDAGLVGYLVDRIAAKVLFISRITSASEDVY